MKILQVIPRVLRPSAGPSYSVLRLCEHLLYENQLTLISTDKKKDGEDFEYLKTFPISLGLDKLGYSPKMHKWIAQSLESKKIDIIHPHSLWMMHTIYPTWEASKFDIPIMCSPRGTLSREAFKRGSKIKKIFWPLLQLPALKKTNIFHATSESEKEDIRRFGFKQPIAVIPNGIDIGDKLTTRKKKLNKLLFLGRLHPIKGIDILLESWKQVQSTFPDWELEIAGPDIYGYLDKLKKIHDDLKLERVIFSGEVKNHEKSFKYQSADVFILPSHSENFGVAVAEALSAGLPCIVSKGAPWKSLEEKNAGWWVSNNIDHVVKILRLVLSLKNETLKEMGSNGRSWMQSDFNWMKITRMMNQTYQWVLERKDKPDFVYLK